MSNPQAEALLGLVGAWGDTPPADRAQAEGRLWANPIICTPMVYELTLAEGEPAEIRKLETMIERGMVVVADDPAAKRAELAILRPGHLKRGNTPQMRAMRKGAKRK